MAFRIRNREVKRKESSKPAYASLYRAARWTKASQAYRMENPLCADCARHGVTAAAEVVDHIRPHKGDLEAFWDVANWQSLCAKCHNEKTARGE
ncbi:MAG: HNH endonuclease [Caulobacteraceae bacterium]|nr:HNH endonuclease [Caulobacteraceae bacterium]